MSLSLGGAGNAAVHAVEDADEAALEAAHETQREVDEAAEQAVEHQPGVRQTFQSDGPIDSSTRGLLDLPGRTRAFRIVHLAHQRVLHLLRDRA